VRVAPGLAEKSQEIAAAFQRRAQRVGHGLADEIEGIHQGRFTGAIPADQEGDIVKDEAGVGERSVVAEPEFLDDDSSHRGLEDRKRIDSDRPRYCMRFSLPSRVGRDVEVECVTRA
jgi:hypothetical protein